MRDNRTACLVRRRVPDPKKGQSSVFRGIAISAVGSPITTKFQSKVYGVGVVKFFKFR
jgi:hypothetical protein